MTGTTDFLTTTPSSHLCNGDIAHLGKLIAVADALSRYLFVRPFAQLLLSGPYIYDVQDVTVQDAFHLMS